MKPESFVQLVGSGNFATVEEEWMRLVESPDMPLERLAGYGLVLSELCKTNQTSRAEAFAWAAIETLSSRYTPQEVLTAAGPFLLAIGESEELRAQVVELYRAAYAEFEGLEGLLEESGLGGGRPVRRALRTLNVTLPLKEGDFLEARVEDEAARVEKIDRTQWRITITGSDGAETLGPVHLSDRFAPASPTDFRVMRRFAPDELLKQLKDDPAPFVLDICRQHGGSVDSNALEAIFVPDLISEGEWKKWWTRVRTVLKRNPHIKMEGRSPYYLTYVERPIALEEEMLTGFLRLHDPVAKLALVEKYVQDCKARGEDLCEDSLRQCHDRLSEKAERLSHGRSPEAGLNLVAARRIAETADLKSVSNGAVDFFKTAEDLASCFACIQNDSLLELACTCLVEARPDAWHRHFGTLLPTFPLAICDRAACRLIDFGWKAAEFEPIVHRIMASPVVHFEALLWLWDGPSRPDQIPTPPLGTILSRIVRMLDECRLSDSVSKETGKRVSARARAVLSARKYERFNRCLGEIDVGLGRALKTQIGRLENIGWSVRDHMVSVLRDRFPAVESESEARPWELEDVLFVTRAGLIRKQEEIERHVNVTMRDNAKAIGNAAERGDLSENSEYKFALEERDLLRARLAQMNAEVAVAQIISPDEIPTDHVGVGTKVTFKRLEDGEPYELSFVGPWEADAERGWLNYKAPLSRKVLGLRVGDTVEFDHSGAVGTYEIVALGNALVEED